MERSNAPVKKALTCGAFSRGEGEKWKRQTREREELFSGERGNVPFRFREWRLPRNVNATSSRDFMDSLFYTIVDFTLIYRRSFFNNNK